MHWGCGESPAIGWLNSDARQLPGVDLCADVRVGLPLQSESISYIASMHALQDLTYVEAVPALQELRRVLEPGGVLRLGLPDLHRAVAALLRHDSGYFYIKDDEVRCLSGKFAVQLTWYGSSRMMYTRELADELLERAGFGRVTRCSFGQTSSDFPEIVKLDNRERETLFVEAVK